MSSSTAILIKPKSKTNTSANAGPHVVSYKNYQDFILKHKIEKEYSLDSIDNLILTEPDSSWKDYGAIIPSPFIFKKK